LGELLGEVRAGGFFKERANVENLKQNVDRNPLPGCQDRPANRLTVWGCHRLGQPHPPQPI
jgi:hypothetical protein